MLLLANSSSNSVAFAALIWWVIPLIGVIGAIAYVVWISKFQDKYSNETNRSVGNFSKFQASFRTEEARKAAARIDQQASQSPEKFAQIAADAQGAADAQLKNPLNGEVKG